MGKLEVGTIVAERYKITEWLASGGMAVEYVAEDTDGKMGKVVLKMPKDHLLSDPKMVEQFKKEVENTRRLTQGGSHATLVNTYDWGEHEGHPFIVMEFARGKTLSDMLDRGRTFTLDQGRKILQEVIEGIIDAHEKKVVHQDISDNNVMVDIDDEGMVRSVRIIDFGLSKMVEHNRHTQVEQGTVIGGTQSFIAPEAERKVANRDRRKCDQYGIGVLAYRIFTGALPHKNLRADRKELGKVGLNSREVNAILKMFADDPDQRYEHLREAWKDLTSTPATPHWMTVAALAFAAGVGLHAMLSLNVHSFKQFMGVVGGVALVFLNLLWDFFGGGSGGKKRQGGVFALIVLLTGAQFTANVQQGKKKDKSPQVVSQKDKNPEDKTEVDEGQRETSHEDKGTPKVEGETPREKKESNLEKKEPTPEKKQPTSEKKPVVQTPPGVSVRGPFMVLIRGEYADMVTMSLEEALQNKGLRLLDSSQLAQVKDVDAAFSQGDKGKLTLLKNRFGAQVFLYGKCTWQRVEKREVWGRTYQFYLPRITLKAVVADTAQILYSKSMGGAATNKIDTLNEIAQKLALGVVDKLKPTSGATTGKRLELVVSGMTYRTMLALEKYLSQTSGIKSVYRRSFSGGTALFEVVLGGLAQQKLEERLIQCPAPQLDIVRITTHRLELEKLSDENLFK